MYNTQKSIVGMIINIGHTINNMSKVELKKSSKEIELTLINHFKRTCERTLLPHLLLTP